MRTKFFIPSILAATVMTFEASTFHLLSAEAAGSRIERLDPAMDALVPSDAKVEVLAEGLAWAEGPVWRKNESCVLFVDIPKNSIYRWKEGEGLSIFLRPAGHTESDPPPEGRELG